jgi:HEAT repeat protein
VVVLVKALSRDISHVRRGAVRGLWEAKDPAAIEPLIGCFYDEDRKVRRLVADALVAIGEPAAQALQEALAGRQIRGKSQQTMARSVVERIRVSRERGLGNWETGGIGDPTAGQQDD